MGALPYSEEAATPAKRHPTLEVLCGRLEAIIIGRAAAEILETGVPEKSGIAVLPSWSWLRPLINVGRKDKEYGTGEGLLMPVRNQWSEGPLVILEQDSVSASYRTRGMGHQMAGQTKIVKRVGEHHLAVPEEKPSLFDPVCVGMSSCRQITAELQSLVDDGVRARWEIVGELEPRVMQTIRKAHSAVSHEIGISTGVVQPMLDEIGLEEVLAAMMYGESERPGSIFRLIELCLSPTAFLNVDPLRYINIHVRRDAETQIRRKLKDPHIGPKIREVARQHAGADIAVVVDEYRKIYPKDRLSINRAQAALSVSPDVMARSTILHSETLRVGSSDADTAER